MKILVVEIDEHAIQSLKPILKLGHRILVCKNGRNARLLMEKQEFDLLMIDVDLAELGGIELLVAVRQKERATGKHLPTVALGSLPGSGRIPGFANGFDHELRKPIQLLHILDMFDQLIESGDDMAPKSDLPVNEKAAIALCDNDEELFHEIIEVFLTDATTHLKYLEDALRNKDSALTVRHAHALKGAAGNICAEPFQEVVARIERAGKNQDLSSADPLFAELTQEYDRLTAHVKKLLSKK